MPDVPRLRSNSLNVLGVPLAGLPLAPHKPELPALSRRAQTTVAPRVPGSRERCSTYFFLHCTIRVESAVD